MLGFHWRDRWASRRPLKQMVQFTRGGASIELVAEDFSPGEEADQVEAFDGTLISPVPRAPFARLLS